MEEDANPSNLAVLASITSLFAQTKDYDDLMDDKDTDVCNSQPAFQKAHKDHADTSGTPKPACSTDAVIPERYPRVCVEPEDGDVNLIRNRVTEHCLHLNLCTRIPPSLISHLTLLILLLAYTIPVMALAYQAVPSTFQTTTTTTTLDIYAINANGLKNLMKVQKINSVIRSRNPHVVVISETKFKAQTLSYTRYRNIQILRGTRPTTRKRSPRQMGYRSRNMAQHNLTRKKAGYS